MKSLFTKLLDILTGDRASNLSHTQRILEQSIDAIVTIDENNTVTFYNDAAEKLWGYPREQVLGENVKLLVPDEIKANHDNLVNANRTSGVDKIVGTNRGIELQRADGEKIWANLSLSKVRINDKIHYTAFVRDVTKEKETSEFVNQMLEQSIDPVVTINERNEVIIFNSAAEKLWGYHRDEVLGKNVKMLVPMEIQHQHDDFIDANRVTKQDKIVGKSREIQVPTKSGELVWCSLSLSRIEVGNNISYTASIRDISQEKSQRDYIEQTLEQAIDAVVAIDPDNKVTSFNSAAETLWGYDRSEVIGQNVKMLVPADIRPNHDALVNANRTTGVDKIVGRSREVPVIRKDGTQRWGNLALSKVQINGKQYYTAFVRDVTEEVKNRKQFETLSLVANETDNSVIITNSDGLIEYANPGFKTMTGYEPEEVIGKKPGDFLQGPETSQDTTKRIREKLDSRQPFYDEILNYHKNGESYWISLAINPVLGENGELEKFISIQANITETKLTALEFNYKLDAISRANAVAEFDLMGKLSECNDIYRKMFGVSDQKEILGKALSSLIQNEYTSGAHFDDLWKKLINGEFASGEFKHRSLRGKTVWISGSFNPIFNTSGDVTKVVMYGVDVTARKQGIVDISSALGALASGNLTTSIDGDYDEEFNILRDDFNVSTARLRESVTSILAIADQVSSGAMEIASGNNDLHQRVESQAASLEETASTMEELTASAEANAENAEKVNSRSDDARTIAVEGKELVNRAILAMTEITQASKKISDIISVIDEIAFQTNLLALNAAVEAARAGDQGRGFAVVAGEVRNLAQRSAASAKEIGTLIKDTVSKVEEGTGHVNTSGEALEKIAETVIEVSQMVEGIAESSASQLSGIQQANASVAEMDSMTQQNAALVEEANAASSEMLSAANKMTKDLSAFNI